MESLLLGVVFFAVLAAFFFIFRPRTQAIVAEQVLSPMTPVYMFVCPERQIAEVASTVEVIRVRVSNGSVKVVRRADVSRISVNSKYQGNWRIEGGSIEQTNDTGDHLWQSESGKFKLVSWLGTSKEELPSYRFSVNGGEVKLDDKLIRVIYESDTLEIVVPESYRGGIAFESTDGGDVDLSGWSNGPVVLKSESSGSLSVGDLVAVASLTVAITGDGSVTFNKIDSNGAVEIQTADGSFEAGDINAAGKIAITCGDGSFTAADLRAGGTITVNTANGSFTTGDITSVEGAIDFTSDGYGDLEIGNLQAASGSFKFQSEERSNLTGKKLQVGRLTIQSQSEGDISLEGITGSRCEISIESSANITVEDDIEVDTFDFKTTNNGDLTLSTVTAHELCSIDLQDGNNCSVAISTINSGSTKLRSDGEGNFDIDTVKGGNCSIEQLADGNLEIDDVELSGAFASMQSDDGDSTIGNLKADTVTCESTANGNMTISSLDARETRLISTGERCIQVEDGSSKIIWLKAENDGDVTVAGNFDTIHTEKSGNGSISID